MTAEQLLQEAKSYETQLAETRHYLHTHPETGFDLIETKAYVKEKLIDLGYEPQECGKAGLIALAKSIAQEMGAKGIRANAIAPGFIETAMTAALPDDVRKAWAQKIPLRRAGQVEDIANTAVFLASDLSSYVTGQVIEVDGGMNM